jgi:hypothetical protein
MIAEVCAKKKWLWGVRTISLQAKALPGASILRTLIIHPPMISTLTILELMVSTHLVSTLTISARTMLQRSTEPAAHVSSR